MSLHHDPLVEKIHFNPQRIVFTRLIFLTLLCMVFYAEFLINIFFWQDKIPLMLNYMMIIALAVLVVLETIQLHLRATHYVLEVHEHSIELKTKKHIILHFDGIHSLDFERTSLDRVFGTGTIIINKKLRIIGFENPHDVFFMLQKKIPHYM